MGDFYKNYQFFTSINRTMEHTSIQNIISDPTHLEQSQICRLFQRHQFPCFQLQDLKAKHELMKNQSYLYFLNQLKNWNKDVENPAKQISECEYLKNEFIFSWLKWLVVQSSRYVDSSLLRLQSWHNNPRLKKPTIAMRPENMTKSYAEEWQIRNSYRSNLPLEIDNYKRRALFQLNNPDNTPKQNMQQGNRKLVDLLDVKIMEYADTNKKQNRLLREAREQYQMNDYLTTYKKSKVHFYKNLSKNYYKPEFSIDKLERQQSKPRGTFSEVSLRKDYRIKTSTQGFRHFSKGENSALNQKQMQRFHQPKNSDSLKTDLNQTAHNTTISGFKDLNTSNIDGLGLLFNPFDSKLKKKKRT